MLWVVGPDAACVGVQNVLTHEPLVVHTRHCSHYCRRETGGAFAVASDIELVLVDPAAVGREEEERGGDRSHPRANRVGHSAAHQPLRQVQGRRLEPAPGAMIEAAPFASSAWAP